MSYLDSLTAEGYKKATFIEFLRERYHDAFTLHDRWQPVDEMFKKNIKTMHFLGELNLAGTLLAVISAEMAAPLAKVPRKSQLNFAKSEIRKLRSRNIDNGLFVFFDEEKNFRISLVTCTINRTARGANTLNYNDFRRQSFYVPAGTPARTFRKRFSLENFRKNTLAELKEVFSVEALTKDFYSKLADWFEWACDSHSGITFPDLVCGNAGGDKLEIKIIRLITRLMFVWFIKQKDLVPAELFKESALAQIL